MRRLLVTALLGTVLASCAQPAPQAPPAAPAVDTAAVVAAANGMWARWVAADTAEDLPAVIALYSEDARVDMKGSPPLVGHAAMQAAFSDFYQKVDYLEATATPEKTVVLGNDLAHQVGTYTERYTLKGQPGEMTDFGRFSAIVARGADGQWRWTYMMGIGDSTTTKK